MKKNVWIFNHYGCTPNTGSLLRHYTFAKKLNESGYSAKVFASNQLHYIKSTFDVDGELYKEYNEENVPFVFINTPKYENNGKKRVINMISYFTKLFPVTKQTVKKGGEKPDVIIASSPHPLTCVAGILIAKRYKVPCIVEIRDLWPESIVEYSERFTKKHPLIKMLYQGEKWIYKKADRLIFTMPGGYDYIKEKKWDNDIPKSKCFHINNGIDLDVFNFNKENFKVEDEDLENDDVFKVVYTGAIRAVNNLGVLIDVAKAIENLKVKFLVWGDGDELETLKQRVIDEEISNVSFKGRVDKKYVPYILSKADANLFCGKSTEIGKFGFSPNKLFDYYSSNKPIISTFDLTYTYVNSENGFNADNQDIDLIVKGIEEVCENYDEISKNALNDFSKCVKEFDFKVLTQKLIDIIETL